MGSYLENMHDSGHFLLKRVLKTKFNTKNAVLRTIRR